jgi:hypothetical protein
LADPDNGQVFLIRVVVQADARKIDGKLPADINWHVEEDDGGGARFAGGEQAVFDGSRVGNVLLKGQSWDFATEKDDLPFNIDASVIVIPLLWNAQAVSDKNDLRTDLARAREIEDAPIHVAFLVKEGHGAGSPVDRKRQPRPD